MERVCPIPIAAPQSTSAVFSKAISRSIQIEYRVTGADPDRILGEVEDLVNRAPDAILASPGQVVLVVRKATSTIPVVFANVPDPVGIGIVSSLARPGGNTTGFTSTE